MVVRVPPALYEAIGSTKLRKTLLTTDPLEADREKVEVVKEFKQWIADAKAGHLKPSLTEQALNWRDAIQQEEDSGELTGGSDEFTARDALDDYVWHLTPKVGEDKAQAFAAVAIGKKTPIRAWLDRWFAEEHFSIGYKEDVRRAVSRLEQWCDSRRIPATVENITRRLAGSFIQHQYIEANVNARTANKDISCLMSYWRWMGRRYDIQINPWKEHRINVPKKRAVTGNGRKRPFTDDEATILLNGIRERREFEFSLISALSGMRLDEVGNLRVQDCADGRLNITKSKTSSGVRTVPIHPKLTALIAERSKGKKKTDYIFDELPEQRPGSKRTREAPVSQAFTRERRRLGVTEKASEDQRQSNIDFHSWRRWFIRKAVDALLNGAKGYNPWIIAAVVGHSAEGGVLEGVTLPLEMTMGRYPGKDPWAAMVACVNAVKLPNGVRTEFSEKPKHDKRKAA